MTCCKFPMGRLTHTIYKLTLYTCMGLDGYVLCPLCSEQLGSPPYRWESEARKVRIMRQWRQGQYRKSGPLAFLRRGSSCSLHTIHAPPRTEFSKPTGQPEEDSLPTGSLLNCSTQLWQKFLCSRFLDPTQKAVLDPPSITLTHAGHGCLGDRLKARGSGRNPNCL